MPFFASQKLSAYVQLFFITDHLSINILPSWEASELICSHLT